MERCDSPSVLHTRRTAMVSAANNYRLATVSTALQRFSRGLESVSLSPHGTSSRGIKRLWRLDFAQDILASLASLALEVDQSLQHVGSELPPVQHPSTAEDSRDALPVASTAPHPITSGRPPRASATLPPPIVVVTGMLLTPGLDQRNVPAAGQLLSDHVK